MQNKIFIITGSQGSGKTEFLSEVITKLSEKGIKAGGIIAHGFWKNNERNSFELENIQTAEKIVLCKTEPVEEWEKFRRFYFNPEGLSFGKNALSVETLKDVDIIIIDEIGPLELEGKGWSDAINRLMESTVKPMIWVVRKSLAEEVKARFGMGNLTIFDISLPVNKVADIISKQIRY